MSTNPQQPTEAAAPATTPRWIVALLVMLALLVGYIAYAQWSTGKQLAAKLEQARALHAALVARNIRYVYVQWDELDRYRRTYDRDWRRTDFITPRLFDRLIEESVLRPLAMRPTGANVSLLAVNEWKE